jgi:glycogen debranching enzyme
MSSRRLLGVSALVAALSLPSTAASQVGRTDVPAASARNPVERFEITPSPISLVADVRPGAYLGVTGPRSAWLGTETGPAELWVHPLKVATDFQLHFQTPQYREPVRGVDVAQTVEVRPEATTITYSHMTFTVKQHVIAPRDEAGLLVLLEVETFVPLEIVVQFKPVLQYMWPGSFGGQYIFWDDAHDAFVLSESVQARNAVIGTSWPSQGEAHPAHRLAEAPATFVIPVDAARAEHEFIPIAIAAGTASRDEVFATYRAILDNAAALYEQSRAWADDVLATTTSIDTPDDSLDLALEWAKINLEEQRVCNPDLGCGFVAGWGMSGASTRPGFGWFFGGDAAINSLAMDATGQWDLVAEDLRFLARYQRADGKIPHEVSQAAGRMAWFEDYPYPYYHADTTPYWMVAVWELWKASGNDEWLEELWPAYQEAWAWCLTAETDGDGIIENTVGGYGAIEVGGLGENLHQDIYLAGVWITALEATEALAEHFGDDDLAEAASRLRTTASATLNERYWRAEDDQHAFGILQGGGTNDNLTAWPGTALSFGLLEPERAERTLRKLATDSISADWGARLLSVGSDLYDPLHYNNGAVWPFMTGFVAWGQYRYRRPWAGYHLIDAVKQHTFDWARGRHPENFSGAYYRPMDATVPHQFFATSMLVTPLLRGVLGWAPDAPGGRATLAPQLPPGWDRVAVRNLRVGETTLEAELQQRPGWFNVSISSTGPPVDLDVVLPVALGARGVTGAIGRRGGAAPPHHEDVLQGEVWGPHGGSVSLAVTVAPGTSYDLTVQYQGGLAVAPPTHDLIPGQKSTGIRIIDFVRDGQGWRLEVEGMAGSSYTVELYGEAFRVAETEGAGAALRPAQEDGAPHLLDIDLGGTGSRTLASFRLLPTG